jgi:hypothetical protein
MVPLENGSRGDGGAHTASNQSEIDPALQLFDSLEEIAKSFSLG